VIDDPQQQFLTALRRELRYRPLARRRALAEIAAHLDDAVAELEAGGLPRAAAVQEALRRLGGVATITTAFRQTRPRRGDRTRVRWLRSPAWIAVGAMSLVTAWAAELPQASGAKATTVAIERTHHAPDRTLRLAPGRRHDRAARPRP
jgi:hypothetical protein